MGTDQTLNNMEDYVFNWGEFQDTRKMNFGKFRSNSDFCDVILAFEDIVVTTGIVSATYYYS